MSTDDRLIAARYVQALFELATEAKGHDQVKADLLALKGALGGSTQLHKLLESPILSRDESGKAIAQVLATLKASDLTCKFFALLARNHRLSVTGLVIDAYLEKLAQSRGELTVQVVTATALGEEEKKTLAGAIAAGTGKKVALEASENPALLGGLQVKVGSRLLDTSVAGKLARLRQALLKAA